MLVYLQSFDWIDACLRSTSAFDASETLEQRVALTKLTTYPTNSSRKETANTTDVTRIIDMIPVLGKSAFLQSEGRIRKMGG